MTGNRQFWMGGCAGALLALCVTLLASPSIQTGPSAAQLSRMEGRQEQLVTELARLRESLGELRAAEGEPAANRVARTLVTPSAAGDLAESEQLTARLDRLEDLVRSSLSQLPSVDRPTQYLTEGDIKAAASVQWSTLEELGRRTRSEDPSVRDAAMNEVLLLSARTVVRRFGRPEAIHGTGDGAFQLVFRDPNSQGYFLFEFSHGLVSGVRFYP